MDIKRDVTGKRRKQIVYWVIGIAVVGTLTVMLSRLERAAPTVDEATLWLDTVRRGELLLERRGAGTLVPEEIRAVAARSAGTVDEIVLLPGAPVEPGTVILRLSNPDLELAARGAASDLAVERYAFAVSRDRPDLVETINRVLKRLEKELAATLRS